MKQFRNTIICLLCASAVLLSLSIDTASGQAGYGTPDSAPEIIKSATLNLLTLNVAHGRGRALNQILVSSNTHRSNLREIADLLMTSGAQVAALQEADAPSLWSGRFDHVEYLAQQSKYPFYMHGYHADAWPFTYGAALISGFRMSDTTSHRFQPSWPTAGKGFVRGTVLWLPGDQRQAALPVTLVSVHLDFSRESVRDAQIAELVAELSGLDTALVIMGDFNADWSVEASPVRELANRLGLQVFEPTGDSLGTYKRNKRLDWILISSELRFIDYTVLPKVVSDHLAVVASIGWEAQQDHE